MLLVERLKRLNQSLALWLPIFMLLSICDAWLTNRVLADCPAAIEANPLMAPIAGTPLLYLKGVAFIAAALAANGVAYVLAQTPVGRRFGPFMKREPYPGMFRWASLALLAVCVWNIVQLAAL